MNARDKSELTDAQRDVYEFICEEFVAKHRTPTVREIQARFSFRSMNSVVGHLVALRRKGWLLADGKRVVARGIRIPAARVTIDRKWSPGHE